MRMVNSPEGGGAMERGIVICLDWVVVKVVGCRERRRDS